MLKDCWFRLSLCCSYLKGRKGGVFHYDRHTRYQLTYHEAEATCQRDFGATLATREQLMAALQAGLEECRAGWITSAEVAYPRVHKHWNCGENRTGIISYGIRKNLEEKWDVFCYKEDNDCTRYETKFVGIALAKPLGSAYGIMKELSKSNTSQPTHPESYISFTTKNILNMWTPAQSSNSLGTNGNYFTSSNFPLQISIPNTEEGIESKQENRNGSENHLHDTSKSDDSEAVTRQETLSSSADIQVDKTLSILYKYCQTNECMRPKKLQSSSTAEPVYKMSAKTSTYTPSKDDQHNDSKIEFSEINRRLLTMSPETYMKLSPSVPSSKNNLDILKKMSFFLFNEYNTSIISKSYALKQQTDTNLSEPHFEAAEDISQTHGDMASEVTGVTPLLLNSPVLPESSIVLTENVESVYEIHNGPLSFQKLKIANEVSQEEPSIKTVSTMDYLTSSSHLKDSHSGRVYTIKGSESKSDLLTQNNMSPNETSTVGSLGDISKGSKTILGAPTKYGNGDFPLNPPYISLTMATAETHATDTIISNFKTKIDFEHSTMPKSQQLEAKDTTAVIQISALSYTVLIDPTYKTEIKDISMLSHEKELFTVIVRQPETSWTQNPTLPMGETTSLSTPRHASIGQWKSTLGAMGVATPAYRQYVTTMSKVTTDSYVTTQSMQLTEEGSISINVNPIKTLDTCGGVLQEQRGRFQSPGFPQSYASSMNCTWAIDAPPGHYITLSFISLVLEEHRNCLYDYVLVFDGTESDSKPLGRFCGMQIPQQIRSTSNVMTVVMRADSSVELDGILAEYSFIQNTHEGVRLKGGQNSLEGVVEVEYNGKSGSICAKQWTNKDAQVACRQIGYLGPAVATRQIGENNAAVAISFIICNGDEEALENCSLKNTGYCSTNERAGVLCQVFESCAALKDAGILESGTYTIDPDGIEKGVGHFTVECDMESDSTTGITVMGHDSENRERVTPCKDPGCYSRIITYKGASMDQLRALAIVSESCEQFIRLDCRNIRFLNGPWGWWVSSNGHQITSWGGATTNSGRCACGEHGNCALELSSCNCDANDDAWRTDEGALTDKSILPVQELRFGDTRNMPMQMAFHSIGKLQCWGTQQHILESCTALKEAGISDSGRYFIDPDGSNQGVAQFEVYCDMSSDAGITVISHDSERRTRVTPCKDAGCYKRELIYTADLAQLNALTKVSESCEQFVRLDCRHLLFLQSGWGWWVSWDGKKMHYWGGSNSATGGCACGKSGTCSSPDKICNCDSNDHVWRTDDGFLRDKEALPIRAVHFGDTDDFPIEMAYHTIGKLRCRG